MAGLRSGLASCSAQSDTEIGHYEYSRSLSSYVFEWKLPKIDKIQGGKEYLNLFVTGDLDWSLYTSEEGRRAVSEHNIGLNLTVEIAAE